MAKKRGYKGRFHKIEIMGIKAIGFDFFGTLVDLEGDSMTCILMMHDYLKQCGYEISQKDFVTSYRNAAAKHRKTRYEEHREVNNCIWAVDALNRIGISLETSDSDIVSAVEKYFSSWRLIIVPFAPQVLARLNRSFRIALISNFTYGPYIYKSLKNFEIDRFFHHIIISEEFGLRKPHPSIFKHFLELSKSKAGEAVFIGDDLESDIKGAKNVGIKSVLLDRSGKSERSSQDSTISPDYKVSSLIEFENKLNNDEL